MIFPNFKGGIYVPGGYNEYIHSILKQIYDHMYIISYVMSTLDNKPMSCMCAVATLFDYILRTRPPQKLKPSSNKHPKAYHHRLGPVNDQFTEITIPWLPHRVRWGRFNHRMFSTKSQEDSMRLFLQRARTSLPPWVIIVFQTCDKDLDSWPFEPRNIRNEI